MDILNYQVNLYNDFQTVLTYSELIITILKQYHKIIFL